MMLLMFLYEFLNKFRYDYRLLLYYINLYVIHYVSPNCFLGYFIWMLYKGYLEGLALNCSHIYLRHPSKF